MDVNRKLLHRVSYAKFSPFYRLRRSPNYDTVLPASDSPPRPCLRLPGRVLRCAVCHAQSSPHRFRFQRQDHPVSADDQRQETARAAHGKGDASIGISKVPDARLDRLTAMYNPRKRVPATVEFTDLVAPARPAARRRSSTSPGYKNADALVHVLRAFHDPAVPHPSGSDRSRARRAGDGRRTHPGGPRPRRAAARTAREGPEEEAAPRSSSASATSLGVAGRRSKRDGRCARSSSTGDDVKRLRGFQFLSAKPLLIVINLDEARPAASGQARRRDRSRAAASHGPDGVPDARARRPLSPSARRSSSRSPSSTPADAAAFLADLGLQRVGPRSRHPRQLRSARVHLVLHGRRGRVPRVVDPARHAGAARRRRDPQRHRAWLHPRRGRQLRRARRAAARWPPAAITAKSGSKARSTSSRTATSSTSGSRHERASESPPS